MIVILIFLTLLLGIAGGVILTQAENYSNLKRKFQTEKCTHKYPVAYHTVDISLYRPVLTPDGEKIIGYQVVMGQKPNEVESGLWRFPGGFVDPTDKSAEAAALRECSEEVVGCEFDKSPKYITSMLTNDQRYRNSVDKIITSFYKIQYLYGAIKAGDDLKEVRWVTIDESSLELVNPIHKELFIALINDLKTL